MKTFELSKTAMNMAGPYKGQSSVFFIDIGESPKEQVHAPKASKKDIAGRRVLLPSRYIIAFLGFLSYGVLNTQRLNLSMALVAMVNKTGSHNHIIPMNITSFECPHRRIINSSSSISKGNKTFNWDSELQGYISSASFFGFVLTQTPGGRFAEILGAKQMLIFSLLCASACNIISPWAAEWSAYMLMAAQFVKGLAQGFIQPSLSCLMAKWLPKPERGFLSSVIFSGFPAGAFVGGFTSGALCDSNILGGWPAVFYVFGFCGIVLAALLQLFVFNHPRDDKRISEAELRYILSYQEVQKDDKKKVTPWIPMFTSSATWALWIGMFGQYWMTFYFISVHPTYLASVLHFNVTQSGLISSIPYILQIFATWSASYVSDWMIEREMASINTMRKLCNSMSCIGFSLSIFGISYAGCDITLNTTFFFIAVCCTGFGFPGSVTVPLDMTVDFAGTLMGLSSTFASISGFIIPLIVSAVVGKQHLIAQWQKVLLITAVVGLASGIVFQFFGSAKPQNWSTSDNNDTKKIAKKKNKEKLPIEVAEEKINQCLSAETLVEKL